MNENLIISMLNIDGKILAISLMNCVSKCRNFSVILTEFFTLAGYTYVRTVESGWQWKEMGI